MIKLAKAQLLGSVGQKGLIQFVLSLIIIVTLAFSISSVRADVSHTLDLHTLAYTITYLEDKDSQLQFYDLFYSPWKYSFRSLPEQTNIGVTNATLWFKVFVPAQGESTHAILEISDPKLDYVSFFTLEGDDWKETKTGDRLPYSQREIKHPKFLKRIELVKDEPQIIYLKIASNSPISILTELWSLNGFHHVDSMKMALAGVLFGALLALIIFNLFIFLFIGGRSYGYYFGYLLFMALFILCLRGLASAYLFPEFPEIANKISFPALYLAMIFWLLFVGEVITPSHLSQRLLKVLNGACVVLVGIGLAGTIFGNRFFSLVTPSVGVVVIALALYVVLKGIKAKYKPSYYVGFAFLSHTPAAVVFALSAMGIVRGGAWAATLFEMGVVIGALLLSLALAYRIRHTENTLARVREEVGERRGVFSRQLIESRDEERQLLASELHDGLGQNLLAIKNKLSRVIDSSKPTNKNIEDAHSIIKATIDDVRRLSHKLHPHILDRLGLKEAVIAVVRDAFDTKEVKVKLSVDETEVPRRSQVALHLYRIVQEGVKNILTHAQSKYVNVEMFQLANTITLRIENLSEISPTHWVPATDMEQGFGLSSIRERVDLLDGQCIFLRDNTGGFRMEVTVPFLQ